MTKNEFFLRSVIAMAGNPNYVKVTTFPPEEEYDEEVDSRILNKEELLEDAAELLRKTEEACAGVFDEDDEPVETPRRLLANICEAVNKIDVQSYLLRDIGSALKVMSETVTKLAADEEDEEHNS